MSLSVLWVCIVQYYGLNESLNGDCCVVQFEGLNQSLNDDSIGIRPQSQSDLTVE